LREQRTTISDDDGRWEMKDLPAGRYQLNALKGGYVSLQYGQRRPFEQGRPLEVRDGQVIEKVDFALPRGSVIAGRLTDEAGEPVTGGMVQVSRYRYFNGQRRLAPVAVSNQTDDRGDFRIFGIPPGDYFVSATLRPDIAPGQSDNRSGYAATYYPGTPSAAEAQRVTVGLGQEAQGISFQLVPARTATISGIARGSDGRPLANAMMMLMPAANSAAGPLSMASGGPVRPDGSFTLSGVAPGDYIIQARPMTNGLLTEAASADITVAGADITGLVLTVNKGVTARGRITFDGGRPTDVLPSSIRISAMPADGAILITGLPATVHDDWTFELEGQSGRRLVRPLLLPGAAAQAWTVKRVQLDGNDVTDTPLDFRDDIDGLEVVLTQRVTTLAGAISDARGAKATDATVVIFADDREKWGFMTRFVRTARPDQDGRFSVRGLPPGRYRVVALDYIEPGEEGNPDTLEQLRPSGTAITLGEGESRTVDLKVAVGM
jgi:hypothetical protein